jgi:hypothetical protein
MMTSLLSRKVKIKGRHSSPQCPKCGDKVFGARRPKESAISMPRPAGKERRDKSSNGTISKMLRKSSRIRSQPRVSCDIEAASPDSSHHYPTRRRKRPASYRFRKFVFHIRRNRNVFFIVSGFLGSSILLTFLSSGSNGTPAARRLPLQNHSEYDTSGRAGQNHHKPTLSPPYPLKIVDQSFNITFEKIKQQSDEIMHIPPRLTHEEINQSIETDLDGLNIKFLQETNAVRNILRDGSELRNSFRHPDAERDDDMLL